MRRFSATNSPSGFYRVSKIKSYQMKMNFEEIFSIAFLQNCAWKYDTFIFAIFKKEWFSLLTPCTYARKILNNNIYSSYYLWRNKEFHTKLPPWRLDGAKKWIHSVTRWSGSHGWFESLTKRKFLVKHLYCTHRKKIIVDNSHEVKVEQTISRIIMFWISTTIFCRSRCVRKSACT